MEHLQNVPPSKKQKTSNVAQYRKPKKCADDTPNWGLVWLIRSLISLYKLNRTGGNLEGAQIPKWCYFNWFPSMGGVLLSSADLREVAKLPNEIIQSLTKKLK